MAFINVSIQTLAAGNKQILQSSRNNSGLEMSHSKCNLRLKEGSKTFVVGRNGCGKSTLFRAIASGELEGWPEDVHVHLVDQDAPVNKERTPKEVVLAADKELISLETEITELENMDNQEATPKEAEAAGMRLNELYEAREESSDPQRDERVYKVLSGLGFTRKMMDTPIQELSGGWRMRALIAAGLFMEPDLLLLDEPTNHLDLKAIRWLETYLVDRFNGSLLCVSHDHTFLNAVADEIIVFTENNSLEYHSGNYQDLYKTAGEVARKRERQDAACQKQLQQLEKKNERREQHREKMESKLENNKHNKSRGNYTGTGVTSVDKASVRSKKDMEEIERLKQELEGQQAACEIDPVTWKTIENNDESWAAAIAFQNEDSALKFAFKEAEPLNLPQDVPMLQLDSVCFHYPDCNEEVFKDIDLSLDEQCRMAIVGDNGAGKSTLVKLLTGELLPTSGIARRDKSLRIAYFGQHDAEMLQTRSKSPLQYLEECFPKMREHELCAQLEDFGVTEEMRRQPMAELSGGQRMRVAFARMCAEEPHLLVLDEPTNHLDIYSIEALSDALKEFQGAVIFVTHNRYLIEAADTMLVVSQNGKLRTEKASLVNKHRFDLDT